MILYSRTGYRSLALADFLPARGELLAAPALITEVVVPLPAQPAGYGLADVARTPSDAPIVLAAAALTLSGGRCQAARVALGGVAAAPVRLPEVEAILAGQAVTSDLIAAAAALASTRVDPAGDFKGSAEYRKAMAGVLAARALHEAWGQVR